MQQYKLIGTYGFAIFAMFFGSGNLVFPLKAGLISLNDWLFGFLGLFLTGIILPFLGLFVIKLHKGNYYNFFGEAGNLAKIILPLFTLSLLGSFGVVPRCVTVAHGGISYMFPTLSLGVFALIFCLISYFLCLKDQIMVKVLGKWMSPLLFSTLLILIGFGIFNASEPTHTRSQNAFISSFLIGYQTMDLFAAFFFSAFMFKQLKQLMPQNTNDKTLIIFAIKASIVGSILLTIIYLGLVFLGAHYAFLIENVPSEYMLPTIANYIIGDTAMLLLNITIFLSCLTTAVALNNIYARYLCSLFKFQENKFPLILAITTIITFIISLLDFKVIATFLAPLLEISYPALIFLTIIGIYAKDKYHNFKIFLFWTICVVSLVVYF